MLRVLGGNTDLPRAHPLFASPPAPPSPVQTRSRNTSARLMNDTSKDTATFAFEAHRQLQPASLFRDASKGLRNGAAVAC